jgi:hypothetical protein
MSESFAGNLGMDPRGKEMGSVGVPKVMKADTGQGARCEEANPLLPEAMRLQRRSISLRDASAFMLGKSETTGRDSYMFFGIDGELMSIKWKVYKTIFRYSENVEKPYIKPQFPMIYDLSSDPHEDNNLIYSDLTVGWILAPNFKLIAEYQRSLKQYPNIKVGEDFKGYNK